VGHSNGIKGIDSKQEIFANMNDAMQWSQILVDIKQNYMNDAMQWSQMLVDIKQN
jgi:hypothetical protein